jgi:uncharacterized ferritin-like protein (DUF455 family)
MELRDLAVRVLTSESIAEKLAPPPAELTDSDPGPPLRVERPARPPRLHIVPALDAKVPALEGMPDPAQRPRIVHALANHELQAAELFAWTLLAFPEAHAEMRRGFAAILADEQRHTRMYLARLRALGAELGDFPVSGYFWSKTGGIHTPLQFVCAMSLTFENANLDHTLDYAQAARRCGDEATARIIDAVHQDEVEHVRFGWRWLGALKANAEDPWQAYTRNLAWPLRPALGRGRVFHPEGRRAAGLDEEFIRRIAESEREERRGGWTRG